MMKTRVSYRIFIILFTVFICFAEVNVCAQGSINLKPKIFAFENKGDGNGSSIPTVDYYSNQTRVGSFDVLDNVHNISFLLGHKGGVLEQKTVNMKTGEKYPIFDMSLFGTCFRKDKLAVSELLSAVFSKNEIEKITNFCHVDGVNAIMMGYAINPRTGRVIDVNFSLIIVPNSAGNKELLSIPVERFERLECLIKEKWVFPDAPEESKDFDYIPRGNFLF